MKTLLILRHAKSSWSDAGLADHQRPLNRRGREAAPRIGRLLRKQRLLPDSIFCSTSTRTRQTCELVAKSWKAVVETQFLDALYHCPANCVFEILQQAADDADRILLIGHNPGLAEFLTATVGFTRKFPTAALAQLTVDLDRWSEFHSQTPIWLENFWRPRDLG